jgi:glycosyltransferase involved in cell wall biosynthesis
MTNYNHAQYLETSLGAILAQTFRPAEVIVVDDDSTDNSLAVLEALARKDPIVRVIRNAKNLGVVAAWHEGYRHVTGDYLYSAAADDCVLPGLFEKSMALLAQYPQAALCCSFPASFQEDAASGTLAWKPNPVYWSEAPCYFCPEELADVLCGDYIPGHTTIMKRSALDQAGGLRPELKWHCDWFATLVMAFRHGICFLPEPLARLRISPASYSAAGVNFGAEQEEVLLELLRLLRSPEYRDVLPYFAASGALGLLNERHRLVRAYFAHPEQWDAAGLALIQQPLWQWCRGQSDIGAERTRKRIEANKAFAGAAAPQPTPGGR